MQQIAMRRMDLDHLNAKLHRAQRAVDETLLYARQIRFAHRVRWAFCFVICLRRRGECLPPALVQRKLLTAQPRRAGRGFTPGVTELDTDFDR